jgi:PAS domain S-box-containing protein
MEVLPALGVNASIDRIIQGYEGSAIAVNARGVDVLVPTKGVPVAGWYVGAALPTAEAFAPIRAMQQRMLLATIFLTLLAGGLTWWMLRRQLAPLLATVRTLASLSDTSQPPQALPIVKHDEIGELIAGFNRLLTTLAQREEALRESQARYSRAVSGANDGIWEWLPATGENYLSPRFKQLLGYEDHELPNVQESFFNQVHPEDQVRIQEAVRAHLENRNPYSVELRLRCKSGEYRWFFSRGQAEWDERGRPLRMAGSISDITERKRAESKIRRLGNLYAALSQCNQAVVHCSTERELFQQICRAVVNFGGMKMAWIGLVDEASKRINPVASYGDNTGYLQELETSVEAINPFGRGPNGIAIRENRPYWCQDFLRDAATLERIFDAFYTTKPVGEGPELGLSMVHGIMRSHGGAVTVESAPGKGSSFHLYFPATREQAVKVDESGPAQNLLTAGQRVPYVDDEETLVLLAERFLARLGHSVAGFTDPEAALAAFRAHPRDFNIVVTDLSMPHLSGFELARSVLAVRAGVPVLMTSATPSPRNLPTKP